MTDSVDLFPVIHMQNVAWNLVSRMSTAAIWPPEEAKNEGGGEKLNNHSFAALKNVHYGDYEFALAFAFALASLKWGSFSFSTKGKLISMYPVDISFLFIR